MMLDIDQIAVYQSPIMLTSSAAILGQIVMMARRHCRLSCATVAAGLLIRESSYCKLEAGEASMSILQLQKLADVLDFPSDAIFTYLNQAETELFERNVRIVNGYGKPHDIIRQFGREQWGEHLIVVVDGRLLEAMMVRILKDWRLVLQTAS